MSTSFRTIFICTGNRCRSPYAAGVFESLTNDLPVEVASAGTLDAPGHRVPKELIDISSAGGLALAEHRSKVLAELDLADFDLIIGFELAHVATAVVDGKAPADKVFTLPELARLLENVPAPTEDDAVEGARAVVAAADAARKAAKWRSPEEVADPFMGPRRGYETMAESVTEMCRTVVAKLFPASSG